MKLIIIIEINCYDLASQAALKKYEILVVNTNINANIITIPITTIFTTEGTAATL